MNLNLGATAHLSKMILVGTVGAIVTTTRTAKTNYDCNRRRGLSRTRSIVDSSFGLVDSAVGGALGYAMTYSQM